MASDIIVSYSELDAARQCLHKHELSYKERWVAPVVSPALSRGTLWHSVMEMHYRMIWEAQKLRQRPDVPTIVRAVKAEWLYRENGSQSDDQELIEWMYDGYVEYYGEDHQWRVRGVEHSPVVRLPTPTGGRSRFKLKLKIDLIVEEMFAGQWRLVIVDHKSGKDLPKGKELDIDDQFGLYTWAMRQLKHPVFLAVHSAARTQKNKDQGKHFQPLEERFRRTPLPRTDEELNTIAIEAYRWAKLAYQHKIGEAPRSPNTDTCKWKCDYTDACLFGRKGGDERRMLRDMTFAQDFTRH